MAAITPSGQSADNIQVEAQALIADGVNTAAGAATVAAPGGPALGALGGAGDIQRPPGAAAEMAIGEFWPSISENDIQRVVDEHRAAEQRFSYYGDTLKRKRSESPNLLQGQAGDARVERLTEMMNHAYAVADHLGSKAVTGESYKSTVVGLKTDLTRIGDAAQKAWEAAQTAKPHTKQKRQQHSPSHWETSPRPRHRSPCRITSRTAQPHRSITRHRSTNRPLKKKTLAPRRMRTSQTPKSTNRGRCRSKFTKATPKPPRWTGARPT